MEVEAAVARIAIAGLAWAGWEAVAMADFAMAIRGDHREAVVALVNRVSTVWQILAAVAEVLAILMPITIHTEEMEAVVLSSLPSATH